APDALAFDAEPALVARAHALEVDAERQAAVDRELVARALGDREVEPTAAGVGVAVFLQPDVVDHDRRAEEEELAAAFERGAAHEAGDGAVPLALDIARDGVLAHGRVEIARAFEVDHTDAGAGESLQTAPLADPVRGQLVGAGDDRTGVADVVAVPQVGNRAAEAAHAGRDFGAGGKAE